MASLLLTTALLGSLGFCFQLVTFSVFTTALKVKHYDQ